MNRLFRLISWATILSGLTLCLYIGYLLTYPFKVSETKFEVLSPVVKPGGNLVLKTDYCKWMALPATSTRQLVDGIIIELPPSVTNLDTGCHVVIRYIPIPTGVPDGKYRYKTTVEYHISILRTVRHTALSAQNSMSEIKSIIINIVAVPLVILALVLLLLFTIVEWFIKKL